MIFFMRIHAGLRLLRITLGLFECVCVGGFCFSFLLYTTLYPQNHSHVLDVYIRNGLVFIVNIVGFIFGRFKLAQNQRKVMC